MIKINKNKKYLIILFSMIFIYIVLFSVMSILKHHAFHSTAFDLSVVDYELKHVSKGELYYTNEISGERLFELHFRPINFLLVPFYWIYPNAETLLILQSLFLGLGALPIYLISKNKLKSNIIALIISGIYLLYVPLQAINLIDFHFNALAIPFLLFAFYFLENNKYGCFTLFSILAAICREEIALIVFMMGIYIILKKNKKMGAIVAGLALIYFVFVVGFLMPYIGGEHTVLKTGSKDFLQNRYDYLGNSYKEFFETIITKPIYVLKHIFTLPKMKYFFLLLFPAGFGIFSVFAPEILMLSLPIFAMNLLSEYEPMYQIYYQYNSGIIPFIFISTIYGIPRFIKFFDEKFKKINPKKLLRFIIIFIFSATLLFSYLYGPLPFSRVFNFEIYNVNLEFVKTGHRLIEMIPKNSSILAPVNVVPHLTEYKKVYMFPEPYPEYFKKVGINKTASIDYIIMFDNPYALYPIKKFLPMNNYNKIIQKNGWLLLKNKDI